MRYSLIIAGGSGTRLWPMSRAALPKQLIPFIGGKSLLQIALDRLEGLVPAERRYVCAGETHRGAMVGQLAGLSEATFLGEPTGRDTLNAVGLGAAVISRRDPDAVIAVLTADHIIQPVAEFQKMIAAGFALAEARGDTLVTFGIAPTFAATGYGYLQLGAPIDGGPPGAAAGAGQGSTRPRTRRDGRGKARQERGAREHGAPDGRVEPCPTGSAGSATAFHVEQFREKPDAPTAQRYVGAGPAKYLWNSGMFVWRAATLMDCIRRYEPATHAGLVRIADAWNTPRRAEVLAEVYPTLRKISVDYAVMEPASRDAKVCVAAVPMPLEWLDVGSWPAFAQTCTQDEAGNGLATPRAALMDTKNTLIVSSDPNHLITAIGCEGLIIVHTPDATLVCRADRVEDIKKLHALVGEKFGKGLL